MGSASAWMLQIGHVCLWGSLLIAAIGAFCRFVPRLPAAVRAWLWWLVCARVLLGLWTITPISLPVLPPPAATVYSAPLTSAEPLALHSPTQLAPIVPGSTATSSSDEAPQTPTSRMPLWRFLILAAWALGLAASLCRVVLQSAALKRQQRGTFSPRLTGIDLDALAQQMGLSRAPLVLTGPNVPAPCITGWFRPVILLPPNTTETLSATELRLALAHEMAHLKRGDLPLALIPALACSVFFFHPLIWWAAAEWAAAREEACDALALSATRLSSADYGRLLLKLATPAVSPPALGFSPSYHTLRRRLLGLSNVRPAPRWARLFVLALPLLLPWRLSASQALGEHSADHTPRQYRVTALAGDTDSDVTALNNSGQVALSMHTAGSSQGYAGGGDALAATGSLPKHHASLAYGINDTGQAAGASFNIPGHARAFFWDGTLHRIGSLPGYPYSEARAVNASGQVAGFSETGHADRDHAWITRAFTRIPGKPLTDLGTLGGLYSAAYAVSQSGTVVGKADTETIGATHAFAWTDGQISDLGTLGGADSVAYAVNGSGQIAGASDTETAGVRHAFLYDGSAMRDLRPLASMENSAAYAVNGSGQTAGFSQTSSFKRATLWRGDQPTDLNTLLPPHSGWTLTEARAINDHGQIAGQGLFQGKPRAFLLTPR